MAAESEAQATDNLALKKKARRRLVGTVALVILSLIILPQILENKSQSVVPEEPVVIMSGQAQTAPAPEILAPEPETLAEQSKDPVNQSGFSTEAIAENLANEYADEKPKVAEQKPAEKASDTKLEKTAKTDEKEKVAAKENSAKEDINKVVKASKETAKESEPKTNKVVQKSDAKSTKAAAKPKEKVASQQKAKSEKQVDKPKDGAVQSRYAVQLGVFADPDNVKKMQAKIALAGFESKTSSVSKGTRLRVGYFVSRQGAEQALETLKQNGLSGKVVAR